MLEQREEIDLMENDFFTDKDASLRDSIENTKLLHSFANIDKKCYMHLINRMKSGLLTMKIETNKLEEGIKKRVSLLENEKLEFNKVKVEKYRAQTGLEQIANNVNEDQRKTDAKVEQLNKQINEKTMAVARRLERLQHQQQLIDVARSDQTDQNEKKLRDQVIVHKFWNHFLRRRMEAEIQGNSDVSDAFEKIRTSTGIEDFQMIVKKFLTRENTYSQLLEEVNNAEKEKEMLKVENDKLNSELSAKRLELDGLIGKNEENEVYKLQKEVAELEKLEQSLFEKYQKCSIVRDQLHNWILKMYNVLISVLERTENHQAEVAKLKNISEENTEQMFAEMCDVIEKLIVTYGHIEGNKKVTVKGLVAIDDYYKDEVYQKKNVRVTQTAKPVLKRSDSGRSSRSTISASQGKDKGNPELEKVQREINSEFRDERKRIKSEKKKAVNSFIFTSG
jgi:hypothetical protein